MATEFTCSVCGKQFTLPQGVLDKYPGWTPAKCRDCHSGASPTQHRPPVAAAAAREAGGLPGSAGRARRTDTPIQAGEDPVKVTEVPVDAALEQDLEQLLGRYDAGPTDGVFTDGGCSGNPGPGGWGAVYVRSNQLVVHRRGEHPDTTNNRMELIALVAGFRMVDPDHAVTVWTDSQLCVSTFNDWADGWASRGWRRKAGPIKNLDLIQPLHQLIRSRPRARLRWVKAHDGSRWNEYVDLLATAHLKR